MAENVPEDMKSRLKSSYDAMADTYADNFTQPDDPVRLQYLGLLLSHLKTKENYTASVLELGCGAGIPATKRLLETEELLIHVTGNDLSTAQLDLARTHLAGYQDRLTLVEGDMMALSFSDHTFDAVTGFYSIIHLPREEQTQLVRKIARWLKPGGFLLANFAVEESEGNTAERWLGHEEGWMYWSAWGEEGSVKMFEAAGLEILMRETKQVEGDANFVWVLAKRDSA
ncbi:methyltransferase [Ascochyta rabiei]|uniref:Methyltransferase n=1 Tax=Didymella rabiei TaxID=5454 RepID=A0A163D6L3_DIDRA|nr:methyltransferase [Ascochyta rabiei]